MTGSDWRLRVLSLRRPRRRSGHTIVLPYASVGLSYIRLVIQPDLHRLAVALGGAPPHTVIVLLQRGDMSVAAIRDPAFGLAFGETVRPLGRNRLIIRVAGRRNGWIVAVLRCGIWRRDRALRMLLSHGGTREQTDR